MPPTKEIDILLKYISDARGMQQFSQEMNVALSKLEKDLKKATSTNDVHDLLIEFEKVKTAIEATEKAAIRKSAEVAKAAKAEVDAIKHASHEAHLQMQIYDAQAMALSARASILTKQASELQRISSRLGQFSNAGLVAGTAVVGGIFAESNRFAKEADDTDKATEATRKWTIATNDLARARSKVDTVLLKEALPLLQKAAEVANQAAAFIEKHPQIAEAALKGGIIVASLSALGILASKGIQLVADAKYLTAVPLQLKASELQLKAANQMLLAAELQVKAMGHNGINEFGGVNGTTVKTAGEAGAGGALAGLTSPTGLVLLATAFVATSIKVADQFVALDKVSNQLVQDGKPVGVVLGVMSKALQGIASTINPIIPGIVNLREALARDVPLIEKLFNRLTGAVDNTTHGTTGGRTPDAPERVLSDTMQKALSVYEKYREDDLGLVQKHYQERQNIVADALSAELKENQKYAASVEKVTANETSSLAEAATEYANANAKADERYATDRAKIIASGAKEIEDIEKASKERLRKLEEEHNRRMEGLLASRDALGLAKERRDYKSQVSDEKRQTNQEIKDRKLAIAQRLADLKQSYDQERAQRLADYQARVTEIQANAAEQLKELADEHAAELQQIQQQKIAKLKELDSQFNAERKRRYDYFIAQIRDLDAALLGETKMRQQYEALMLQDLDNFLASYRAGLASLSSSTPTNPTGRASGGYASYGTYTLGDSPSGGAGGIEYVLSNRTVQAAESIVGGRLTQEGLLAAMSGRGANVTLNNNARYSGEYTASMRRAVMNDMRTVVNTELKRLIS